LLVNHREKELSKLKLLTLQAIKDVIEPILTRPIHDLNPEFWDEIRGPYLTEMREFADHCQRILSSKTHLNDLNETRGLPCRTRGD
jgi:hypothetical protein